MRSTIRVTLVVGLVGYFGLVPEVTYSFYKDSRSQLSNWHPSDEVPCLMWLYTEDLATICFGEVFDFIENCGGQRGNRTPDTRIFNGVLQNFR